MACIIGNVNVLVQLHHTSTTNEPAKVGEVLTCSENNKYLVLTLEKEGAYGPPETRRLYFDRCYNSQKVDVFNDSRLEENIQFSISGGNSVVFNLGVGMGKHTTYDRMKVLAPFMETLKRQDLMDQKNMTISYAYLGVTDSKCVDLQTERSVTADLLNHGVDPFLSKIQSFDEIQERLDQGCTLPFVLAIRFETSGAEPTSGTFYLVDMGVPRYIPLDSIMTKETPINSAISGVSKSFYLMRKITTQLTTGSFVGPLPYDDTYFTLLTSDFFSGNCKSLFVFNVETNEKHLHRETLELLEFAEILRKMKLREKINKIDRRVIQHERRSKQYKVELKKIQVEYEAQFGILRQQETLLQESQDRNDALEMQIQKLTQDCVNMEEEYEELKANESMLKMDAKLSSTMMSTELVTLKEDIRRVKVNLSLVTDERDNLMMKCSDFELKLAVLQDSLDEKSADYEDCHRSLKASELKQESTEEILRTLRSTYNELKETHNQILEKLTLETQHAQKLQKEKDELEEKLHEENKKFVIQALKVENLEKANSSLEAQLEKETVKMEKERKKWLLEKNSGDKESESFIHKISDLEQTIRKLRADVKNEQIASEKQRNEMTDRIEAVNRELGAAKAKSDLLTAEHHLKQERWSSEKKDMLHQIKELQLKLNNAEAVVKTNEEFQNTTQQGNSKMEEKFQKLKEKLVKSLTLASDSQTQLKEKTASWNDERLELETQIKSLEKKVNEKTSKSSDLIQKRQAKHRGATKVSQDPQSDSEDDIISIVTKPISKRQKPAPVVQESAIVEELTDSEPEEKPVKKNNKRIASESKQTDEPKKPAKKQALKAVAQAEEPAPVPSPKRSRKKPTKAAIEIVPQQDEEKTSQSVVSEITANESKKASPSKFGRKKASPTISMNTSIDSEDLTSFDEPAKKVITVKKPMERKKKSAIEDSSAIKASETSEPEEKSPPQAANLKKKISFNRKRQSLATNTDIPDEPAVKKKRKIALGKNRQSIGLNTSTETTGLELPPQPSNISAAARSRYSIAPNIGKGPGSLRNGSGNHRISILGSAGNPKQNGLPPLPGNGRNALNLPRKLGQMKSAESLESIKSSFSISNILNK